MISKQIPILATSTIIGLICFVSGCSNEKSDATENKSQNKIVQTQFAQQNSETTPVIKTSSGWQNIGLGGGGAFFYPAASPHDDNLLFVSSDMGGFYRSVNKGKSWQTIDWRQMRHARAIIFHPTDNKIIYAIGWEGKRFKVSHDQGVTWKTVIAENHVEPLWKSDSLLCLTIDQANPKLMLLAGEAGIYHTTDAGQNWTRINASPKNMHSLHVDQTSPANNRICYGANKKSVFRSNDHGKTWREKNNGLPGKGIRHFSASSSKKQNQVILFCTVPSIKKNGQFTGGVFRSIDQGESWSSAMGEGIHIALGKHEYGESDIDHYHFITQSEDDPNTVFVTNRGTGYHPPHHYTVYRSTNGGKTWEDIFFNDPRFKENNTQVGWLFHDKSRGFGDFALGFAINPRNAKQVLYTNFGEVFLTNNAGENWKQIYSQTLSQSPRKQRSIGLEDTSCWRYVVDPHNKKQRFICYTDIGFARSEDNGNSWSYAANGIPWNNTIYDIAFDPTVFNKMWAACSTQHDIPMWQYIQGPIGKGGVVVSHDAGKSWQVTSSGLPQAPVTAIIVDSDSTVRTRRLFAAVYGHGIYVSHDAGKNWTFAGNGIEPIQNRQVVELQQTSDGTLFCSVAARRKGKGVSKNLTGGIYRSTNKGKIWEKISSEEMFRPVDFVIRPDDKQSIYVAAMDGMGKSGGVYITHDGGRTWKRTVPDFDKKHLSYIEGYSVALHPTDHKKIYFTSVTHGLFISHNDGKTWQAASPQKSPPFMSCLRIHRDPLDATKVFITTFGGGIWHGQID